jgi:hypothetical protein
LGIIEEANLTGKHASTAYNKIKDITTAPKISIERKGLEAYEQRNCLHIVQTGQFAHVCPILEAEDTRVVCVNVERLAEGTIISQNKMSEWWALEAPYFIRTLRNLKLSDPSDEDDRLFLPPLFTPAKADVIAAASRLAGATPSEQVAAELALRIEQPIYQMAKSGQIIKVTATEVRDCLRGMGVKDVPDSPNLIGQAINHLKLDGFILESGKSDSRRWMTIAAPDALAKFNASQSSVELTPPSQLADTVPFDTALAI